MIPYDADPSLYTVEPLPAVLDDGFSPPPPQPQRQADRAGMKPQDGVDASLVPQAFQDRPTWQLIPSSRNR